MDLSNIITATPYNTTQGGIADPIMNGITKFTGYEWFINMLASDCYKFLNNIYDYTYTIYGLIFIIIFTTIIGEIVFYNKIKVAKASNKETINNFITRTKLISYVLSFMSTFALPIVLVSVIVILSIIILNLPIFLVVIISATLFAIVLMIGILLLLKIIISVNKKLFGHLIKQETLEEYEAKQTTYKFHDGTVVKVKPNIVEGMFVDNHKVGNRTERMSKKGEVYIITEHNEEGRVILRDSENNSQGPGRWECFLEMASLDEIIKFNKEKAEHEKEQVENNKMIINKFFNWCTNLK